MVTAEYCLAFGFGTQELLIVSVVLLFLFGGTKIPQLMRGMGQGIREFRSASSQARSSIAQGEANK